MANSVSALFQTLVAAASEASKLLAPTWNLSGNIFWDYKPHVTGGAFQTIDVAIPQDPTNSVQDIGNGDVVLSDIAFSSTPIVLSKHPEFGFVIRDLESILTTGDARSIFLDAALKGIKNNINGNVANLFTSTNFNINPVASTTGHVVTVPQFLSGGMAVLADKNVPVNSDPDNMAFVLPSAPYMAMLDGTTGGPGAAWAQAFIVGERTADEVHRTANMPMAFATRVQLDQQMPTTGAVGSRTFTGAYFHRYAVAGVSRALPKPDGNVVDYTYLDWGGLSLRIQLGYNQYPKGGYICTIDAVYGLKVVRPEMGVLFSIAE